MTKYLSAILISIALMVLPSFASAEMVGVKQAFLSKEAAEVALQVRKDHGPEAGDEIYRAMIVGGEVVAFIVPLAVDAEVVSTVPVSDTEVAEVLTFSSPVSKVSFFFLRFIPAPLS